MTESGSAKPRHLEADYAAQFGDEAIAAAYRHRPPYAPETFVLLEPLLGLRPRVVVELGAGTGDFTMGLAPLAATLIAVEPSRPMRERGQRRVGAVHGHVEWCATTAEDYPFDTRYSAVVAAESFHWLDWPRVLPAIAASLVPAGQLILVERALAAPPPWAGDLHALIRDFSTNQDYVPYDLVTELESRRLIRVGGRAETGAVAHVQSLDDYIESFHSRNGFSRARLSLDRARQFDDAVRALIRRHGCDDVVRLAVRARIAWGRPIG
jgi:SAM-dependent methyltransferase